MTKVFFGPERLQYDKEVVNNNIVRRVDSANEFTPTSRGGSISPEYYDTVLAMAPTTRFSTVRQGTVISHARLPPTSSTHDPRPWSVVHLSIRPDEEAYSLPFVEGVAGRVLKKSPRLRKVRLVGSFTRTSATLVTHTHVHWEKRAAYCFPSLGVRGNLVCVRRVSHEALKPTGYTYGCDVWIEDTPITAVIHYQYVGVTLDQLGNGGVWKDVVCALRPLFRFVDALSSYQAEGADAVGYAHRDMKMSNLAMVDGKIWVIDFGLMSGLAETHLDRETCPAYEYFLEPPEMGTYHGRPDIAESNLDRMHRELGRRLRGHNGWHTKYLKPLLDGWLKTQREVVRSGGAYIPSDLLPAHQRTLDVYQLGHVVVMAAIMYATNEDWGDNVARIQQVVQWAFERTMAADPRSRATASEAYHELGNFLTAAEEDGMEREDDTDDGSGETDGDSDFNIMDHNKRRRMR